MTEWLLIVWVSFANPIIQNAYDTRQECEKSAKIWAQNLNVKVSCWGQIKQ